MHEAYKRACQLEWMFWDSAWREADWPGLNGGDPLRRAVCPARREWRRATRRV